MKTKNKIKNKQKIKYQHTKNMQLFDIYNNMYISLHVKKKNWLDDIYP